MNLKSAFWQLELHPDSQVHTNENYTLIQTTHHGHKTSTRRTKHGSSTTFRTYSTSTPDSRRSYRCNRDRRRTLFCNRCRPMQTITNAGVTLNTNKCTFWSHRDRILGTSCWLRCHTPRPCQISRSTESYHTTKGRIDQFSLHDAVKCRFHPELCATRC